MLCYHSNSQYFRKSFASRLAGDLQFIADTFPLLVVAFRAPRCLSGSLTWLSPTRRCVSDLGSEFCGPKLSSAGRLSVPQPHNLQPSQEVQGPVKSADNSSTTDGTLILNFFWTAYKILRPGPTKNLATCSQVQTFLSFKSNITIWRILGSWIIHSLISMLNK